jgi:hypothetical protein
MKNSEVNSADPKKNKKKPYASGARKIGYLFAIVFMILALYILRHLREWGFTFLTEDFGKCLFYIELSIYVSIAAQVLFILYDNRWFKHLIQGISNIAGALSLIMIYVIFPFNIEDGTWFKWIRIGILIIFGFTVISIIVEFIKGFRYLAKDPEAI